MIDIRSVEKDLEWGIKQEQIVKPRIEEWIEHNLDKTPDYFNIFDFNQDEDANNIPDTNPNVVGGPNDQLAYNTLFANIINADAGTQATVNQEQIDFLNSLSTFINNLSGFSTTNFTGFKR